MNLVNGRRRISTHHSSDILSLVAMKLNNLRNRSAGPPHMQSMVHIGIRELAGRTTSLSPLLVQTFVFLFVYSSHRVLATPLDRLRRAMAHSTCFPPRKCLLGVSMMKIWRLLRSKISKKNLNLGWGGNRRFKPKLLESTENFSRSALQLYDIEFQTEGALTRNLNTNFWSTRRLRGWSSVIK